jgi:putative hemolysin
MLLFIILLAVVAAGCQTLPAPRPNAVGKTSLANPASTHCIEAGGSLMIRKREDGGEYGVCAFKGDRQCEEWALARGECPVGGVSVSAYTTAAARYCAITGGKYAATPGSKPEKGVCTLKSGRQCDAEDLYAGKCQ